MATSIKKLRKGGLGIEGTERNAKHHAEEILPYISAMKGAIPELGFKEWIQGHNVHQLVTYDGRIFVLRPTWEEDDGYNGVKLLMRLSRTEEVSIIAIQSVRKVPQLLSALELMTKTVPPKHAANSKEF